MRVPLRTSLVIFFAALVGACESSTTQPELSPQFAKGGNGVVASATGSGVRVLLDGEPSIRHFQFNATTKADGSVSGQYNLTFEGPGNGFSHGRVVCMRVEGNRAWIGTVVTRHPDPFRVGRESGVFVEDNGEGTGTPDRLSLIFSGAAAGTAQAVCDGTTGLESTAVDIAQGNIQVR